MSVDFTSAESIIQTYLAGYGLESLAGWAMDTITKNPQIDRATFETLLYDTAEFKARYPAFNELRQTGRGITVQDYQNYEKTMRETLQLWGIPQEMYGTPESIADLLRNDVSAAEASWRIEQAAQAAYSAPVEARNALTEMYGVGPGGMVAYWLDPDKAQPILERQWAASQIAGAAKRQEVGVDVAEAERLASLGITQAQADQGFSDVAQMRGLTTEAGETVSQADLTAARFGTSQEAANKVERVRRGRVGQFQGGGGAAETQQGVSGLGKR
jgi:hypothetical protein